MAAPDAFIALPPIDAALLGQGEFACVCAIEPVRLSALSKRKTLIWTARKKACFQGKSEPAHREYNGFERGELIGGLGEQ